MQKTTEKVGMMQQDDRRIHDANTKVIFVRKFETLKLFCGQIKKGSTALEGQSLTWQKEAIFFSLLTGGTEKSKNYMTFRF